MEWIPVTDLRFRPYGQVLEGYDFTGFFQVMGQRTPLPEDGTVYVPSLAELEALPVAGQLRDRGFGGLEVQIGYCNGTNFRLTCLEYHRTSEIDIACDDMVLLLARQPELEEDFTLDTGRVPGIFCPGGHGGGAVCHHSALCPLRDAARAGGSGWAACSPGAPTWTPRFLRRRREKGGFWPDETNGSLPARIPRRRRKAALWACVARGSICWHRRERSRRI